MKAASKTVKRAPSREPDAPPRVVYARPPVLLATVVGREETGWRVRLGDQERTVGSHDSVDPALLEEALSRGATVVIDNGTEPKIAGVLMTSRALTIDREGSVVAKVQRMEVDASEEMLLKTPRTFLQLTVRDVELYGVRISTRAREVVKILGSMVKLN